MKNKIEQRQTANRELISLLSEAVEKYPHLRFGQLLCIFNIVKQTSIAEGNSIIGLKTEDPFHEESIDTLERVKLNNGMDVIDNN